jgi:molybdopterin molybdotransferase
MSALLAVEDAQARLFALATPLSTETLPLTTALNRYLAAPLVATRTQPAADLSAMDGYAIRFADLPGPWRQTGNIAAGTWPDQPLGSGETMRIFTGAPLPKGADTVLIQEDAAAAADTITLTGDGLATQGQHVRVVGSDFSAGATLVAAGASVTSGLIALAAMAGHVALISTGDELVDAGAPLAPGQIPDSNAPMLTALLATVPAQIGTVQRIGDDRAATIEAIRTASTAHDVIVTLGGASVGDHDHAHAAMTSLGSPPAFWKIAMRPGKPLLAGRAAERRHGGVGMVMIADRCSPGGLAMPYCSACPAIQPRLSSLRSCSCCRFCAIWRGQHRPCPTWRKRHSPPTSKAAASAAIICAPPSPMAASPPSPHRTAA